MQPIGPDPIMERPASRGGRIGDRGGSRLDASDEEEELSRAESFHSRRSHTTTGGTGHSRLVQLILMCVFVSLFNVLPFGK